MLLLLLLLLLLVVCFCFLFWYLVEQSKEKPKFTKEEIQKWKSDAMKTDARTRRPSFIGRLNVKKEQLGLTLIATATTKTPPQDTAPHIAPSSPKSSPKTLPKTLPKTSPKRSLSYNKSMMSPSMAKEESQRHEMAMHQAKQLLLMDAITPSEYEELVRCHQAYIQESINNPPSPTREKTSSTRQAHKDGAAEDQTETKESKKSKESKEMKEMKEEVMLVNPPTVSRQKMTRKNSKKRMKDPMKKNAAQRDWLSYSLATHFSSYDDLHSTTQSAWGK